MLFHEYLLQYAGNRAEQIAIVYRDVQWTYQQLQEYAEMYSRQLSSLPLNMGDRVVLEFEPCPQAVALEIACSMIGLIFIPISPDTPSNRLSEIIKATEPRLFIQNSNIQNRPELDQLIVGYIDGNELVLDSMLPKKERSELTNNRLLESDLAYIIFTSGTTGHPKGIMMSHLAVVSFFKGMNASCSIDPSYRIGSASPLQFDFSILDMGLAFGNGATLVQVPRLLVHHPQRFQQYLNKHKVSLMSGVPSIWRPFLKTFREVPCELPYLFSILYAGESFSISELRALKSLLPSLRRIINCFGQSESIACTFNDIYEDLDHDFERVSIGYGQPGSEMILLDNEGSLIDEPDIVGELYLRGPFLFSGYWKDPELTAKVLVVNPLRPESNEKVFRTGDLACRGERGEFYYVGREDSRVNIFGNRVELAEISQCISQCPGVMQAETLLISEKNSLPQLWVFVVSMKRGKPTEAELREFVAKSLPLYMLPSRYVFLDQLPITVNGKVDKVKLVNYANSIFEGENIK